MWYLNTGGSCSNEETCADTKQKSDDPSRQRDVSCCFDGFISFVCLAFVIACAFTILSQRIFFRFHNSQNKFSHFNCLFFMEITEYATGILISAHLFSTIVKILKLWIYFFTKTAFQSDTYTPMGFVKFPLIMDPGGVHDNDRLLSPPPLLLWQTIPLNIICDVSQYWNGFPRWWQMNCLQATLKFMKLFVTMKSFVTRFMKLSVNMKFSVTINLPVNI